MFTKIDEETLADEEITNFLNFQKQNRIFNLRQEQFSEDTWGDLHSVEKLYRIYFCFVNLLCYRKKFHSELNNVEEDENSKSKVSQKYQDQQ